MQDTRMNRINLALTVVAVVAFGFINLDIAPVNAQGFAPPAPPPVGHGSTPAPVTPGDSGSAPPIHTGQHDPTPGHNFPTGIGRDRTRVQIFRNGKLVQTLRPDQLSSQQLSQMQGVLGTSLTTGEAVIDANVNEAQLAQIDNIMQPQAVGESPAPGLPRESARYVWSSHHPLQTVPRFARYLVILGVVSATIFMSLAAWSMVLGHPYGASRVVGAAAGLILLLSGYTIWKIVQMNTTDSNSDNPAQINTGATTAQVQNAFNRTPPPNGQAANGRSGFPVQPFRNAQN